MKAGPQTSLTPGRPTCPGFEIDAVLHETSTMALCRARRTADDRRFLIRLLLGDFPSLEHLARLEHEHEVTRELGVEGVLEAVELVRHDRNIGLLLTDFSGQPLSRRTAEGPLEVASCLEIGRRLAEILGSLHDLGVIHKDVKPENVLVDPESDDVRLTGLGVASRLHSERQQIRRPDLLEGSLAYMSPEQTGRMNRAVDYRSDLYSMGVTLYEMLTGELPFAGSDPMEILHGHVAKQAILVDELRPDVPSAVSRIVSKLLAKTAEDRYQTAFGLAADLRFCRERLADAAALAEFAPGRSDVGAPFQVPAKLYGRESEVAELLEAFASAAEGTAQLLLVTGHAGIGKSSLVGEIHKPVQRAQGYFIAGKFDQLQRTRPYSALIQAFQELVHQLLAESDDSLAAWKERLLAALAPNAGVIVELIPEIELIVGPQPAVPVLGPAETRNRFDLVWQAFICAVATREHPLVIFLDDLQWVDQATLRLLERLTTDPDSHHLFVLGAYRDNEVDSAHPLQLSLDGLEAKGVPVGRIELGPLALSHMTALISDALRDDRQSATLAELVLAKTGGNPFFLLEFLKLLVKEGLLAFDRDSASWQCDPKRVRQLPHTDNVVELLVERIRRLGEGPRRLLMYAACIGNTFDLHTLASLEPRSPAEMSSDLRTLTHQELIHTTSDLGFRLFEVGQTASVDLDEAQVPICRFLHDRVQQAAYSLLDRDAKHALHFRIGRLLLRRAGDDPDRREEYLFDLVHHLNLGCELLAAQADRDQLIQLNLEAARKAKASTAYDAALVHLEAGAGLLPDDPWSASYDRTLAFALERAECSYLSGRFQQAETECDTILSRASSDEDRRRVDQLKIIIYTGLSRYADALSVGLDVAHRLGLPLPASPKAPHIVLELARAKLRLLGKPVSALEDLPPLRDPRQLAIVDLLLSLVSPAFLSNETLAILISLRLFNLSIRKGFSRGAPYSYMLYGIVNSGMSSYRTAGEFGRLALKTSDEMGDDELAHVLRFLFATAINHWQEHAKTNLDLLLEAYKGAVARGDLVFADFALITAIVNSFFLGEPLDRVSAHTRRYFEFFERARGNDDYLESLQGQGAVMQRQHTRCLQGRTRGVTCFSDDDFDEEEFERRVAGTTPLGMFNLVLPKMQMLFLFGRHAEGLEWAAKGKSAVDGLKVTADVRIPEYFFYRALLAAGRCDGSDDRGPRRLLRANRRRLRRWADTAVANYGHRFLLVCAEAARVEGAAAAAMDLYDEAIAGARKAGYLQVEAIAHELAGRFHARAGRQSVARAYLEQSRYAYERWGATTKLEALEAEFPYLATSGAAPSPSTGMADTLILKDAQRLDLATVMKAAEAISNELELQSFLRKLLTIIMENAGAQLGQLIVVEDERLTVRATGSVDRDDPQTWQVRAVASLPVDEASDLAGGIVTYVARTRESILLHDAGREGRFTEEPHIRERQVKSILCSPLVYQGKLSGIVYLENNLTTHAFTPERVEFIRLLSGQAAITLQNAKLYSHQVAMTASASRFVPHEFLELLDRRRLTDANLGDSVQMEVTILVSDIRSFTTISEGMTPRENFEFINAYLGEVGPIIRDHGGFVAKYTGDGMMALFPGDPARALDAAIATLNHLSQDRPRREQAGEPPIRIGIGLHRGSAMLGIVGEMERMQCDAMSDAANLAARIEGLTKVYGASLLLSGQVLDRLPEPARYAHRFLGRVRVKGRSAPVRIYEILDGEPESERAAKLSAQPELLAGLELYMEARFEEAAGRFRAALERNPDDRAVVLYLEECAKLAGGGAPPDWHSGQVHG